MSKSILLANIPEAQADTLLRQLCALSNFRLASTVGGVICLEFLGGDAGEANAVPVSAIPDAADGPLGTAIWPSLGTATQSFIPPENAEGDSCVPTEVANAVLNVNSVPLRIGAVRPPATEFGVLPLFIDDGLDGNELHVDSVKFPEELPHADGGAQIKILVATLDGSSSAFALSSPSPQHLIPIIFQLMGLEDGAASSIKGGVNRMIQVDVKFCERGNKPAGLYLCPSCASEAGLYKT